MNTKYSWLTASAALLTILGARDAAATPLSECYVDATGTNDADCGTVADPCETLKYAVNNRVDPGADVYMVGGTPHKVIGVTLTTSLDIHGLGAGSAIVDAFAIACDGDDCASLKVVETDLRSNVATGFGGAIYSRASSTTVKRCTFEANSGRWGAAIASKDGDLFVIDTQFSGNFAFAWGGGIFGDNTDTEVRRSSFVSNEAPVASAIFQFESLLVANTTFAENTATFAGTITGSGTLWNLTMVNNEGAAAQAQDLAGDFHIENSIITHPNRGDGEFECVGTTTGERYLTDGTTCGGAPGRLEAHNNEGLGSLGYHNGPTLVYKLYSNSNAVGVPDSCMLAQDQRNAPRPATECDLGAYELQ